MPRDLPIGNGDLLVNFDDLYRVRDMYYPHVGALNHTLGHVQHFGVWADKAFAWVSDKDWERDLRYLEDSLVTEVRLRHRGLGLEIICNDVVDFHDPVHFRRVRVQDQTGKDRDVRLFYHIDLSINGSPVGDTANYDPQTQSVVLYKDESYFIVNASSGEKHGIDHWAIGHKKIGGAEGTWRDAEDGELGRNAISQGSVDATVGFNLAVPASGEAEFISWIGCGHSYTDVRELNDRILEKGPTRMINRTEAYWRLWCRKEPMDTAPLPEQIRNMYYRSQLIMRTQIDNDGAILAANDSDIAQFGGDHYSYCWMRDGALVAHALVLAGQSELSRSFFRYAERCIEDAGYFLHKYTPKGSLASSWHPWTINGKPVLPIQQDETALVLWALRRHFEVFRDVEFIKPLYSRLIAHPAEWMMEYRDRNGLPQPSWDLWEERRGVNTFTVAATIGALDAAADFATDFGESDRANEFRDGAERMRAAMRRHLWNAEERRFARTAIVEQDGAYRLDMTPDSANFAIWAFAGLKPTDADVEAEMTALRERLLVRTDIGGYARYKLDYYHQVEAENIDKVPGNPWVICTLWQAWYLVERARTLDELKDALPYIDWTVAKAEPSGVLAEQFHPFTGEPISVSPLTWSHATFVVVCVRYLQRRAELLHASAADQKCSVLP
ncbi:MAG: glycoside hydrolase family 15 protein [Phycisphaeraceae bacterium]|nr:MAG: glycoside hydrolase family 15 protein [Phycisphaeraceae bacterium]